MTFSIDCCTTPMERNICNCEKFSTPALWKNSLLMLFISPDLTEPFCNKVSLVLGIAQRVPFQPNVFHHVNVSPLFFVSKE